ncbi:MAG: hypothetical protein KC731_18480 [Myxococcales bacterium]|nr:hypothetical protein [Myxococcales bacterium]
MKTSTGENDAQAAEAQRVAGRLASELRRRARVWLDPGLAALEPVLGPRIERCDRPQDADELFVHAREVGPDGAVMGAHLPARARGRVTAIVLLEAGDRITARARGEVKAARVVTGMGVLELRAPGLVIVELARGVSARDLQGRVDVELFVSPDVQEMIATAPPTIV